MSNNKKKENGNVKRPNRASNALNYSNIDNFVKYVLNGRVDLVTDFIYNSDPDASDSNGFTPLTALLFLGSMKPQELMSNDLQEQLLSLFIGADVDFDVRDRNGTLPIFAALAADFPIALRVMNSANPTGKDSKNANVLMKMAEYGLLDILEQVYHPDDFNLNAKDDDGNTIVHYAVRAIRPFPTRMEQSHPKDVVQLLCSMGADTTLENNAGQTPADLAYEIKRYDVVLILNHCVLPIQDIRRIVIKLGDVEHLFYVNLRDTVDQVKKAFFLEKHKDYNLYFPTFRPADKRIMEDARTFSDYGIKDNDTLVAVPIVRSGFKGGRKNQKAQATEELKTNLHNQR